MLFFYAHAFVCLYVWFCSWAKRQFDGERKRVIDGGGRDVHARGRSVLCCCTSRIMYYLFFVVLPRRFCILECFRAAVEFLPPFFQKAQSDRLPNKGQQKRHLTFHILSSLPYPSLVQYHHLSATFLSLCFDFFFVSLSFSLEVYVTPTRWCWCVIMSDTGREISFQRRGRVCVCACAS